MTYKAVAVGGKWGVLAGENTPVCICLDHVTAMLVVNALNHVCKPSQPIPDYRHDTGPDDYWWMKYSHSHKICPKCGLENWPGITHCFKCNAQL